MKTPSTPKWILMSILNLTSIPFIFSQITFSNSSSLVPSVIHSGNAITVMDVDGDGLDDIFVLDNSKQAKVFKQKIGGNFVLQNGVSMGGSSAWSMVVGDLTGNGYKDVVGGFNGNATLSKNSGSSFTAATTITGSNYFLQNMNLVDVDNDGDLDLFGCNDVGLSKIWLNDGNGNFTVSNIINFDVTPTDDSGNYGSVWSDFDNDGDLDLYIAKCRQGVNDTNDARRINILFVNNGNGTFTENAAGHGLKIKSQSWTANFEDINNDGWFDVLITNHDVQTMLMLNNGAGQFTNINVGNAAGLNIAFTPYESKMADFDNDGYVDVLFSGSTASGTSARLFRNNGDNTFSPVPNAFPTNKTIHSFGVGDLNFDGKLDIYAGYGTGYNTPSSIPDILWLNSTDNANHYVVYNLQGTTSNRDAVGARVFIYGPWGVQTREVRVGESYGNCNSLQLHFGLGTATSIDSTIIKWPSGTKTKFVNQGVDQVYHVKEGDCISPQANVNIIGTPYLCNGASVTLEAPSGNGYTYLWNTGATTQSVQVSTTGEYSVQVKSGNCKTWSPKILVEANPDQTPSINIQGSTTICEGEVVVLEGPAGMSAYAWNSGEMTQSIIVSQTGDYFLTVSGYCEDFTSSMVHIEVLSNPLPVGTGDEVFMSGSGTLSATGSNIEWYDAASGGNLVGTGNTFITPVLNNTTTYYAQNVVYYPGDTLNVGQVSHSGSSDYSGSNSTVSITSFEVYEPLTITSFKVYTDKAGTRVIEIKDLSGNVVASESVFIPITTLLSGGYYRVPVHLSLNPGNYTISTNTDSNMVNLGYAGPRLKRSNGGGVAYPYTLANYLSITGTTEGNSLYYYFYDWEVEVNANNCVTSRVPVTLTVLNDVGVHESSNSNISIYPNPTNSLLNIKGQDGVTIEKVQVIDLMGKVITNKIINAENTTISLENIPSGLYVIKIKDSEKEHSARIIKR